MTKKKQKKIDYKTWILVGLSVIGLVLIIAVILSFTQNEKIESSYFHDDEGKIVLTMEREMAALDDSKYEPWITHVVYYHDGSKVTNVRAFYEYSTEEEAKEAFLNLSLGDFADSKKINGRFVIFQVKDTQYKDLTLSELKNNVENLKEIEALILDYEDGYIKQFGKLNL